MTETSVLKELRKEIFMHLVEVTASKMLNKWLKHFLIYVENLVREYIGEKIPFHTISYNFLIKSTDKPQFFTFFLRYHEFFSVHFGGV